MASNDVEQAFAFFEDALVAEPGHKYALANVQRARDLLACTGVPPLVPKDSMHVPKEAPSPTEFMPDDLHALPAI